MDKQKEGSLLLGIVALLAVVVIVALVGIFALQPEEELIQGEAEASEYRVSGKVSRCICMKKAISSEKAIPS